MSLSLYLCLRCLLLVICTPVFAANYQLYEDLPYGDHHLQKLDVYIPVYAPVNLSVARQDVTNAPVLFLVHGGAWRLGDKASRKFIRNKVKHWTAQGVVVVSTNYRLLPNAQPVEQALDVANAIKFVQTNASQWGADPNAMVLMGHSAGAHLLSLISAQPDWANKFGIKPWLGTVALDSAAFNVVEIMSAKRSSGFYRKAFGDNQIYWHQASPIHQLTKKIQPFLAVCSSQREDSCSQANAFVTKVNTLGGRAQQVPIDLSHGEINKDLGKPNRLTHRVDQFLATLHPAFK